MNESERRFLTPREVNRVRKLIDVSNDFSRKGFPQMENTMLLEVIPREILPEYDFSQVPSPRLEYTEQEYADAVKACANYFMPLYRLQVFINHLMRGEFEINEPNYIQLYGEEASEVDQAFIEQACGIPLSGESSEAFREGEKEGVTELFRLTEDFVPLGFHPFQRVAEIKGVMQETVSGMGIEVPSLVPDTVYGMSYREEYTLEPDRVYMIAAPLI